MLNAVRIETASKTVHDDLKLTEVLEQFLTDKNTIFNIRERNTSYESKLFGQIRSPLHRKMQDFAEMYAGLPVMYGICLQNQHLDPRHHKKKLNIKNGHSPFLYSLIGSWGPLLLPLPWMAFGEWWRDVSSQSSLLSTDELVSLFGVEDLVTNHYWRNNRNIWTPWITRY